MKFNSEISSICVSKTCDLELAYVSLFDAPYYSLNIISLANETMTIVARMPISAVLELAQMKKFCQHQMIRQGQVFSKFNHETPTK